MSFLLKICYKSLAISEIREHNKSTDINREGCQLDYDEALVAMNDEQKSWLKNALALIYPSGHPWNNNI